MTPSPPDRRRQPATVGAAALAVVTVLLSACADRSLTPRPDPRPGAATWTAVWLAAALATTVVAALILVTGRRGHGRRSLATLVLSIQAALAWMLLLVGAGLMVRGLQLIDEPFEDRPTTLVRLPAPDGDTELYTLLLLGLVIVVGLPAVLLTLASRFTTSPSRTDRWLAFAVVAAEVGFGGFAIGLLIFDVSRTWPVVALAANVVPSVAALVAAWPSWSGRSRRPVPDSPPCPPRTPTRPPSTPRSTSSGRPAT